MPRVSVILPAYNAAATLGDTLASLRAQTFADWEAIVVDDGSTDDTAAIATRFGDPRIRAVRYPNGGQAIARNRGLELAKGEFAAFLDADDRWTPDKLADQVAALDATPAAVAAYSWTDYTDAADRLLHPGFHLSYSGWVYAELLANNFIENGSNPLVRRSVLERVGGFDTALIPAEDWDFWLRLAKIGEFVAVPAAQVRYRVSETSSSASLDRLERACCAVLDRHLADAPPELRPLRRSARGRFYKGLACKALTAGPPGRSRGRRAARLMALALWYQPGFLREARFQAVLWLKIAIVALLPQPWSDRLLARRKGS